MVLGRSAVWSTRGMVAAAHPLAAAEGLRVLREGGNAADAVLAMSAVMSVAQPMMSGLGGDTFCVWYDGRTGEVWALNGSGAAPRAATPEAYAARGYTEKMPLRGMLSVAVPGAVDAAFTVLERWGSGRFSMEDLWRPAIRHAREGVPVARMVAEHCEEGAELLARYPSSAHFLRDGRALREGETLVLPDYARSLERVAREGRDVFYRGELAERIAGYCQAHGGLLDPADLAEHRGEVHRPIAFTYRGHEVHVTAPPSQGIILLEALAVASGWDLGALPHLSAEAVHRLVEAKKLAFADRNAFLGDPRFVPFDASRLLAPEWVASRRARFDPARAAEEVDASPLPSGGSTTYMCAADRDGNALSFITSLSAHWGCGEVVEGTGILMNNRCGRGFSLAPGHPNRLAPGKRTMHTLQCYVATRGGRLRLVGGTPGGDGQPQWNLQVLTAIWDWGLGVQAAAEAPRWLSSPGTDPAGLPAPFTLTLEEGFPEETLAGLQARGHRVTRVGRWGVGGGAQLIEVDPRGAFAGGSDPRTDGCALGF
jgi:gamma-glutamyltranspeptidase/glutathione hydrolase